MDEKTSNEINGILRDSIRELTAHCHKLEKGLRFAEMILKRYRNPSDGEIDLWLKLYGQKGDLDGTDKNEN